MNILFKFLKHVLKTKKSSSLNHTFNLNELLVRTLASLMKDMNCLCTIQVIRIVDTYAGATVWTVVDNSNSVQTCYLCGPDR